MQTWRLELTRLGCDIVTGGGPGLMQAANEGVHRVNPKATKGSMGIRVDLPFEQEVNAFVTEAFEHQTFFTRLHHFVLVSDAFIVVPGGIGSVLETMMVWQLLQVQKLHNTPLILAGKMYAELVEWCKINMLREDCPLASKEDMTIPICVNDGLRAQSCGSSASTTPSGKSFSRASRHEVLHMSGITVTLPSTGGPKISPLAGKPASRK